MERGLHNKLVTLLLNVPGMEDFATRSNLLVGIPNRLALPRSQANPYTDISGLISQLAEMRLRDGRWAILILIDNALPRLGGMMDGEQLEDLRLQIETLLQQKEHKPFFPTIQPAPAAKKTIGEGFPHGYAVIVGIAAYRDTRLQLSEAIVKDAMGMHNTLRNADYCGYADNHVRLRYNEGATAEAICKDLEWLKEMTAADEEATAIFYFSGHGGRRVEIDGQVFYYLLPANCDLDNLDGTAIIGTKLAQLLHDIQAPRLLVLLDSCYSGGLDEIKGPSGEESVLKYGPEEDYYGQLAQGQGRVILASSGPTETSRSSSKLNNSLFTYYLLKALQGEDASLSLGDGLIRVSELHSYVSRQVPMGRPQHPVMTTHAASNFPIALYRGGKKE